MTFLISEKSLQLILVVEWNRFRVNKSRLSDGGGAAESVAEFARFDVLEIIELSLPFEQSRKCVAASEGGK